MGDPQFKGTLIMLQISIIVLRHSGTVNTGNGSVAFTNLPDGYIPGETYSIESL